MNRGITLALLLLAAALVAFLIFIEPQMTSTRDRKNANGYLLDIVPEQIRFITITSGNQSIEMKKRATGWKITAPIKDLASEDAIDKILHAVQDLKLLDEVTEADMRQSGLKLKDFGVGNAKQTLEIGGDQKIKLIFGKDAAGDKRMYVRRSDSDIVYVVNTALQDAAFRNADDFRDKRLTNLDSDHITSFSIRRAGGEMQLERSGGRWEITKPLHCDADSAVVNNFLDQILKTEILKTVSSGETEKNPDTMPDMTAKLILRPENSNGKDVVLGIEGPAPDNGDAVLATLSSRGSTYELPKSVAEKLHVTPESFRDNALLRMNPDVLDRVVIEQNGQATEFHRKGDVWVTKMGDQEKQVTPQAMADLLKFLQEVQVSRFIPASDSDLPKYGLDKPALTLRLQAWLSENTPEEQAGGRDVARIDFGKREGANMYARKDDKQEVLLIPAGVTAFIQGGSDAWSAVPTGIK